MNPIFPELPTKLGIYSLTQLLAVRENSELYSATQSYVDRVVAIEVLRPGSSPELVSFFQETARCRAAATLPHVSPVLESTQTGVLRYLIQELPKGRTLAKRLEEDGPLSVDQAFTLVQNIADMYCACLEQGMAAWPLSLDSIFVDEHGAFSFFSPVIAGEITDEQRAVQMESLANILESALPEEELASSNISIIIHWLRNGYGNTALAWPPLASSLSTMRAQKYTPHKRPFLRKDMWKPASLKRRGRRYLRTLWLSRRYIITLGAAALLGALGAFIAGYFSGSGGDEPLPALTESFLYCGTPEQSYRVSTRPVSLREYAKFLQDWGRMTTMQQKDLCAGMPADVTDLTPLQWNDQIMAADLGVEWQGRVLRQDSPVCGVSYWGALAYARYVGGMLPSVAQVKAVRQQAGEPLVEEWTSSGSRTGFPLDPSYAVYPVIGNNPISEVNPTRLEKHRSFRVTFDNK